MDNLEIEKIAIKNALEHDGKASEGAVIAKVVGEDKSVLKNIADLKSKVAQIVHEINSKSLAQLKGQAKELDLDLSKRKVEEPKLELKPLPDVKGEVVLRLPPEPAGYMHLGNAISFMINYLYKEKYGGKLWLRYEDTNPILLKDMKKFIDSFENGMKWLGIKWDEKKFISSDMEILYRYGEKLIQENKAYVCKCSPEKIKEDRLKGAECEHRDKNVGENLELWAMAKKGSFEHNEVVVRFKGDMKSKDFSLRDPNLFRIIKSEGSQYSLWPTYDIANVVEDYICKITHILRSNEFKLSLQDILRETLGLPRPKVIQFGRYNFNGTPFAKRKLRALIKDGSIPDWNDIRLPTVSAIARRGIRPEAIKDFVLTVGYSGSQHKYSWDLLFTLNRRIIDDTSKRLFFVSEPKRLEVSGAGERTARLPMHPSKDLGEREIETDGKFFIDGKDFDEIKTGNKIRLKDLYSIKIKKKSKGKIEAEFISNAMLGDEKIIQWVTDENTRVVITVVGQLLNDDGTFNKESLKTTEGLAEKTVGILEQGQTIQFERFGFCILDKKETNSFIYISR